MFIFDNRKSSCASAVVQLQYLYDITAMQSMMAGYFGGYSAKLQDLGSKELQRLREALERKIDRMVRLPLPKAFQEYSKRLLKDLEAKSLVRTAVESLNLSVSGTRTDVLRAECIRTFPTITFPAAELLRREEVETHKAKGKNIDGPLTTGSKKRALHCGVSAALLSASGFRLPAGTAGCRIP